MHKRSKGESPPPSSSSPPPSPAPPAPPAPPDSAAAALDEPPLPEIVEGVVCTAEQLERKRMTGGKYMQDISLIEFEYVTTELYETPFCLSQAIELLAPLAHDAAMAIVDASSDFDGLVTGFQLVKAWAQAVHRARNSPDLLFIRRTPENTPALLMIQRLEHLRGQVSEMCPISLIVLCREDQLLFTRDRIPAFVAFEKLMAQLIANVTNCVLCQQTVTTSEYSTLQCGHIYHDRCLEGWVSTTATRECPLCDTAISVETSNGTLPTSALRGSDAAAERIPNMEVGVFAAQMKSLEELERLCLTDAAVD